MVKTPRALLKRYVDSKGMVDYARWHSNLPDLQRLGRYVRAIANADPSIHSQTSQLAFYLNAYNALVLADVLASWPVDSVLKEEGFFDGRNHTVAGQQLTLNELEHDEVIRPRFSEPRIHFVLVCAALDCPRLRTTALTAANLEAELAAATAVFVPQATELQEDGSVQTSQLFNWFAEDFIAHSGSIAAYLRSHLRDDSLRQALESDQVTITFSDYDWSINAPR